MQEAGRLIPLLNSVPYNLTLTLKAGNDLCDIKRNCPQNNLKEKAGHLQLFLFQSKAAKDLSLCSSREDSLQIIYSQGFPAVAK